MFWKRAEARVGRLFPAAVARASVRTRNSGFEQKMLSPAVALL